jgi:uncharacterized RDD family membrane protein YckC
LTTGSRSRPGSPADPLRRCVALGIDIVIAVVVMGPAIALAEIVEGTSAESVWLPSAAAWFPAFVLLYSPLAVSRWGGTAGKRILGMEVVRDGDGGGRLSYGAALVRHLSNVVLNTVPVFVVAQGTAANLSEKKRGLHDRLVGSRVVMRGR